MSSRSSSVNYPALFLVFVRPHAWALDRNRRSLELGDMFYNKIHEIPLQGEGIFGDSKCKKGRVYLCLRSRRSGRWRKSLLGSVQHTAHLTSFSRFVFITGQKLPRPRSIHFQPVLSPEVCRKLRIPVAQTKYLSLSE